MGRVGVCDGLPWLTGDPGSMKLIDELEHCYTARSDPVKMAQNH